jgi:hypothetical protein
MVKHEPSILQIFFELYEVDKVHTTSRSIHQHLKEVDLFLLLPWKDVVYVLNCRIAFHIHDVINDPSLAITFK